MFIISYSVCLTKKCIRGYMDLPLWPWFSRRSLQYLTEVVLSFCSMAIISSIMFSLLFFCASLSSRFFTSARWWRTLWLLSRKCSSSCSASGSGERDDLLRIGAKPLLPVVGLLAMLAQRQTHLSCGASLAYCGALWGQLAY